MQENGLKSLLFTITQEICIIDPKLLHNFNINMATAVILSPKLDLYELPNPRYKNLPIFCRIFSVHISFSAVSRKINIFKHMLLHKLNINMDILHLLSTSLCPLDNGSVRY